MVRALRSFTCHNVARATAVCSNGNARIAVEGGDDVGAERLAERGLVVQRVAIGLADQIAGNVGVAEPLADAVNDRGLERVMVEDVLVDEGRELRLAARGILRLLADARPDRIDLVEGLGQS